MIKYNFSLIVVILISCGDKIEAQQLTKPNQELSKIKWEIKPFLEAKTIKDYNAEYGQIIFTRGNYDERQDKAGVASVNGTIIIDPIYRSIHGYDRILSFTRWNYSYSSSMRQTPTVFENLEKLYYLRADDVTILGSGYVLSMPSQNNCLIKDKKGKVIKTLDASSAITHYGWIVYNKDETSGLLNRYGEERIPLGKFKEINDFENGFCTRAVLAKNDEEVIIDTLGNILGRCKGGKIVGSLGNTDFFLFWSGGYDGVVSSNGVEVVSPNIQYQNIKLSAQNIPLFRALKNDFWSVYNFKGDNLFAETFDFVDVEDRYILTESEAKKTLNVYVIPDLKLIKTIQLNEGQRISSFAKDEKTGRIFLAFSTGLYSKFFYSLDGAPLLDEKTRDHHLLYGCIKYSLDGKYGMISTNGKEIIPPIFEDVTFLSDAQTFWAKQDNKWGLLKIKP